MTDLTKSIDLGEASLQALYALQTQAMKSGDLATQKALEDDIDDLTYKLTQLNALNIAADDQQIDQLNDQLTAVTKTAQAALTDLKQISTVLSDVVTAAKILDGILSVVAKI